MQPLFSQRNNPLQAGLKNYLLVLMFTGTALFLFGCGGSAPAPPDVSGIQVEISITRLERQMLGITQADEAIAFIERYPAFAETFLMRSRLPHDSLAAKRLVQLGQSVFADTLLIEAEEYFGNMADVKQELEQAFRYVKYYFPEYTPPPIYTVITGYGNDLIVSDTAIFIGLDYFMGKYSRYRAPDDPDYIFKHYSKELITPSVMLMLSSRFNEVDEQDNTLLAQMIAYGKAYEFTHRVVPSAPDSLIIRYTGEQLKETIANQDIVWAHFIEQDLFFETSYLAVKKYIEQRPFTSELGQSCPGRIGTWLGWQIVRAYMRNNSNVSLTELMATPDAQKIFERSKYRPKPSA